RERTERERRSPMCPDCVACEAGSERESDASHHRPRLQEMRAAERRQEIIQRNLIGKIGDLERCRDSLASLGMDQVIRTDAQIQYMAWLHAVGIVVIVLLAGLRQGDELGRDRSLTTRDSVIE